MLATVQRRPDTLALLIKLCQLAAESPTAQDVLTPVPLDFQQDGW